MLSPAECRAHFRGAASHGAVAHPPRHRGSSQVDAHAFSTSAPSSTSAADPALGHARRQLESAAAPTKAAYLRYLLTGLARALPPAGRAALLDAMRARNAGRSTDAELAAAVRGLVDRCAPAVSCRVARAWFASWPALVGASASVDAHHAALVPEARSHLLEINERDVHGTHALYIGRAFIHWMRTLHIWTRALTSLAGRRAGTPWSLGCATAPSTRCDANSDRRGAARRTPPQARAVWVGHERRSCGRGVGTHAHVRCAHLAARGAGADADAAERPRGGGAGAGRL